MKNTWRFPRITTRARHNKKEQVNKLPKLELEQELNIGDDKEYKLITFCNSKVYATDATS